MENWDLSEFLSVYPNPTNGFLFIEMNNNQYEIEKISVINNTGLKIDERYTAFGNTDETYKLDLSAYCDGLYLIVIQCNKKIFTFRTILFQNF